MESTDSRMDSGVERRVEVEVEVEVLDMTLFDVQTLRDEDIVMKRRTL